jgi:hypothetical protein
MWNAAALPSASSIEADPPLCAVTLFCGSLFRDAGLYQLEKKYGVGNGGIILDLRTVFLWGKI